ncbi:MAG: RNA pyrophosphohydrolase [Gammaproteobacteria bacterium]|nr:RNA pyrophosphohydrolase [Gammaproteobacteria bacterium]
MIDADGFRPNVGIILINQGGQVLWARRVGQDAWQFPQGGIRRHERPDEALFRELYEEVGLTVSQVKVIGCTRGWLRYRLPERFIRRHRQPLCVGQKQRWYILRFVGEETDVCLTRGERPEFDDWRWVDYWTPLKEVVFFKRQVYQRALEELAPLVGRTGLAEVSEADEEGPPEDPGLPLSPTSSSE